MDKLKETILIVDDSELNRLILKEMLKDDYNILEAKDGIEAIKSIEENIDNISIILLDIIMPKADGFDVLHYMKQYSLFERMPVVMISTEHSPEKIKTCYELGAADFISRPFDIEIVKRRVANTILLYSKQRKLSGIIASQISEKEKVKNLMVSILSHIVEFRNGESGLHVLHITKLTELMLKKMMNKYPDLLITPDMISQISNASALHDIGKIVIPENILNKPGKLTKEEYEVMKTHSMIGANILMNMPVSKEIPLLKYAYEICRWHHERWDGSGYPDGIKGNEIPLSAQVVSIVDVYDALTSKRCYKEAFSHEKAMDIILNEEKGKYNPIIVDTFIDSESEFKKIVDDETGKIFDEPENSFENIRLEIEKYDDLSIYNRGLQIIKLEKAKADFASDAQKDIYCSYRIDQDLLGVSKSGFDNLNLPSLIKNPNEDKLIIKIFDKDFISRLEKAASITNFDNPDFMLPVTINKQGFIYESNLTCRAVYLNKSDKQISNILFKVDIRG